MPDDAPTICQPQQITICQLLQKVNAEMSRRAKAGFVDASARDFAVEHRYALESLAKTFNVKLPNNYPRHDEYEYLVWALTNSQEIVNDNNK